MNGCWVKAMKRRVAHEENNSCSKIWRSYVFSGQIGKLKKFDTQVMLPVKFQNLRSEPSK
jgi:hypothetical protein